MLDRDAVGDIDLSTLYNANGSVLGYFVRRLFSHYLAAVCEDFRRLRDNGLAENLARVTDAGRLLSFDFHALHIDSLSYAVGLYLQIYLSHKAANVVLLRPKQKKTLLLLRGFDSEGIIDYGGQMASGLYTHDAAGFERTLVEHFGADLNLIKVASSADLRLESVELSSLYEGPYDAMVDWARRRFRAVFLNTNQWQDGVLHLLDRADHIVVHVTSVSEGLLWELGRLDASGAHDRVTVVFDEDAFANRDRLRESVERVRGHGSDRLRMVWDLTSLDATTTPSDFRAALAERFPVTSPEDFVTDRERHRARIDDSTAPLNDAQRSTWMEFRFHPAVEPTVLEEIRQLAADVEETVTGSVRDGVESAALLFAQTQLWIYLGLLLGRHDQVGRAMAYYGGIVQAAIAYLEPPGLRVGGISARNRESHVAFLRRHLAYAEYTGTALLSLGGSHEFDDLVAVAKEQWRTAADEAVAAVSRFYDGLGGDVSSGTHVQRTLEGAEGGTWTVTEPAPER